MKSVYKINAIKTIGLFFVSVTILMSNANASKFEDQQSRVMLLDKTFMAIFHDIQIVDDGLEFTMKSSGPKYKVKGKGFEKANDYDESFILKNNQALEFKSRNTSLEVSQSNDKKDLDQSDDFKKALSSSFFTVKIIRDQRSFGAGLKTENWGMLAITKDQNKTWSSNEFFANLNLFKSDIGEYVWVWALADEPSK